MLEIKNLTVKADEKIILKDFSLSIKNNEIHTLMGLNGSGKSTICKVIMGDSNYVVESGSFIDVPTAIKRPASTKLTDARTRSKATTSLRSSRGRKRLFIQSLTF